ncbi:hypothetical protein BYT27DRAFT_7231772 [Phlegmacium glaucopus]|nr:hypothetical protein BYT27DRAFT_7231772 [Phlegmacium glaucopus]
MVELPTELWLRIAYFVPDVDLYRLTSVNRLFFDLTMDRRYRQLIIDHDRPLVLINKLSRLERDPLVASRVRSLTIHPKAVRSACLRSSKGRSRCRPATNQHWPSYFRLQSEKFAMLEDIELADRFLAALENLHCIEEYVIEWKQGIEAERSFCLPLLSAMWPLYGHNLQIIKLDMMLTNLCDMLGSVTGLDRVQELSINLTCNHGRFGHWGLGENEAKDAFERLATFMNRLALSLQSLTLSSIGHLNFSWLYSNLSYFPHLTYLALLLPCDPHHVVDPTAFHHFLRAHRSIEHLNFSPQYCCYQSSLPPEINTELVSTDDWLNRCFTGITFQNLQRLELGLNVLGSGGKRVMLPVPCIGYAARNVRSLGILGRIISLADLALILNPFSRTECGIAPRTLVLEVHVLDVNLLDLLADYLPELERLDLTYSWVHSSGCTTETQFVKEIHGRMYSYWKLWELVLRCSRHNDDARWPCQQAISRCIPGLHRPSPLLGE